MLFDKECNSPINTYTTKITHGSLTLLISNVIMYIFNRQRSFFSLIQKIRKMSIVSNPIETSIKSKLENSLQPSYLKIINESYMHSVPKNSETHFKVVVVSKEFKDMSLIKRHRIINDILKSELQGGVHALSIVAKTPDQWTNDEIESSPNCRGGFGK